VDAGRLGQVIDNLISNAVKFSREGTTVRVGLRTDGPAVRIRVQDQGQGIPAEDQEQLFNMFRRASVEPTAGESSTGLGLAIAKKVVDAHGGQIVLESAVGSGSTFTVSLPLNPAVGGYG
jgi:signal transduction histidine kinase